MKQPHHQLRSVAEAYIRGEVSDDEAAWFEACITSDDSALALYMEALADIEAELPTLEAPDQFAERLIAHEKIVPYRSAVPESDKDRPKRWYERPLFHYTIAASITMLFMFSGAYERLLPAEDGLVPAANSTMPSYSERWVDTTTGWIDQLLTR
ncbi:hypothetical protein ABDI30_05275 [Paenibacillus cisolokensis]|uniref:hypothetical protein n=1 Tax=Paenibacillus cisolokensis TaxID=1658519 RepID=UPI003D2E9C1E